MSERIIEVSDEVDIYIQNTNEVEIMVIDYDTRITTSVVMTKDDARELAAILSAQLLFD